MACGHDRQRADKVLVEVHFYASFLTNFVAVQSSARVAA